MVDDAERLAVITPTYRADLSMVRDLCGSMDRHFRLRFRHQLIVPRCDLALFAPLAGPNRVVRSKEDVLAPHGFRKLPFPARIRIPGLVDRRFKEQWYLRGAGRLSGWLVQQIIKLSAPELAEDEHLLFIDSDVVMIRDFGWDHIIRDGAVRLHRHGRGVDRPTSPGWRANARTLIGRGHDPDRRYSYIGQLIAWRRSNVVRLQQQIEQATGQNWRVAIARLRDVSEYILYGIACDDGPIANNGHVLEDIDLVHSLWLEGEAAEQDFARGVRPNHVAIHVQSVLPMTVEERAAKIRRLLAQAPDLAGAGT